MVNIGPNGFHPRLYSGGKIETRGADTRNRSPPVPAAITNGIVAKPHEAVYKTHKYFARRPGNVFNHLVKNYSYRGDIILDPFAGGGVTVVEALRERRKVIGVDLNPMAIFITESEIKHVDLVRLKKEYNTVLRDLVARLEELYLTKCDKCGGETPAEWFEWSNTIICTNCGTNGIVASLKKVSDGRYQCEKCASVIDQRDGYRSGEELHRVNYICRTCHNKQTRPGTEYDMVKLRNVKVQFDTAAASGDLVYPEDQIPDGNLIRENALYAKGFRQFNDFFTVRNLMAAAFTINRIRQVRDVSIRNILAYTFSSSLKWAAPRLCHLRNNIVEGWATHDFRVFPVFLEINFLQTFRRRFDAVYRGKEYSNEELGNSGEIARNFEELRSERTFLLMNKSSTDLSEIPDFGVDVVITDPPYGSNVQYGELSDFWAVWLKPELGINGLIDNSQEASSDRHFDFEGAKDISHYKSLLTGVLRECWKKLKPNGWLVMTFHNKDLPVWNSLLVSAYDAGFHLEETNGVIYQPPIKAYTTTSHQRRGGSMLGDFILSFRRSDTPPSRTKIEEREVEKVILKEVRKVVQYHGGAAMGTIYLQLIPFLTNNGLLDKVAQSDLEPVIARHFAKYHDRWYFKDRLDQNGKLKPLDFIPAEKRITEFITSTLKRTRRATLDEIYASLYTNLINGMTPETEEIESVLKRIARKRIAPDSKRDVWELKTQTSLSEFDKTELESDSESKHNRIIRRIATIGEQQGFDIHVGEKEQREDSSLREMSLPMGDNVTFGLLQDAWLIVRQIDLLWLSRNAIVAAFEIEKSTTINSGITRFRNLFASQPNANIRAFIVVPSERLEEAQRKVLSPANIRDGLDARIEIITFENLDQLKNVISSKNNWKRVSALDGND